MRKIIFSVLLASVAAVPAMAAPRDDRAAAREERQAEREKEREERKATTESRKEKVREEAPARVVRPDVQQHHGNVQPVAAEPPVARQRMDRRGVEPAVQQDNGTRREMRQQNREERQDLRQQDRGSRQELQQQTREGRQDMFQQRREQRSEQRDELRAERVARQQALRNVRPPVVSNTPRPGTQPPPAAVRPAVLPAVKWNSKNWRNDRRYDWNKHRNKYWWLFQLGSYYDPFGWGYQPYQTGWRMWPSYYSSNYWINDPYYYRLPYAPRGTRWVRYWDDAVLVDTWSGQVVDVIYNFFW
ncbi:MAG: RcnB family protein [Sphingomicrobium sp.]